MASPGRLEVQYDNGSVWVPFTTSGDSLVLELEIQDSIYSPQVAKFKIADLKDNGPFAASSINGVLTEFMNVRILDPVSYIVYFSGKIYRIGNKYQFPYGAVLEVVCYDALYNLGNEFLDTDADSLSGAKASARISTWIGNHISTGQLTTSNDGGDVNRFETSAYERAENTKKVKAGRSQISILKAILQEAIQDQILTAKDRGYIYYSDPNFTSTATSHRPAQFLHYYSRNRRPANANGTSGDSAPNTNGLTLEAPDGTAISESGQKHLMMSELDISSAARELVTDVIANYYHEETGKRVSKRFSIIHYTAISSMAEAQYAGIGFDADVGTGGSDISNLVDSGNNVIGRIQYMSQDFSANSIPGYMILSDRTSHALVAGETLSADSHGSGVSLTLSSVNTLGTQFVYEPKTVWGVTRTMKSNFGKESNADEIRTKLAAIFEGRQNVPDRMAFSTNQLPHYWAQGRATSSTTGSTLHDSAVSWELKGVRTGATFLKLDGDDGATTAYGYVSGLTTGGVITCPLNTGTWAVNDYYKWQVRVRAGHQVFIKCVQKGISGESQLVTSVRIQQNMGSATIVSWETQGAAARTVPTALAESNVSADAYAEPDGLVWHAEPIGKATAHFEGKFTSGAKSSPDGTRHYTLNWTAGALKFNKNLSIDGIEADSYAIAANDTTSIVGVGRGSPAALTPGTEYTLYFDPDTDNDGFLIAETTDYQSVDRSRIKIARILPVASTGNIAGDAQSESECLFELQSTIILEGAAAGESGPSQKLGGEYFAVDGIQAKHMLTIGSDSAQDERFKFNTPSSSPTSGSSTHWFRGFTGNSSSDTTGKWFEFDVANKALNFYNGAATSLLQSQFTGTGLTFYKALATTATIQNKLSAFSGTGLSFYDGTANGYLLSFFDGGGVTFYNGTYATARDADRLASVGEDGVILYEGAALGGASAPLKFLNDATTAANAANIGLQGNDAYSSLAIMGAAGVNTGSAIQFQVANRSYGTGTTASAGLFKIGFGDTTYVQGHEFQFSGQEGYDLTLKANFADTSGSGGTTYGHVVIENYTGVIVEDGSAAAPSITFAGSAGKDTGLYEYETGGNEYLGITANGVVAAYFGENGGGIYFYENTYSYHMSPLSNNTYDLGFSGGSGRWRKLWIVDGDTTNAFNVSSDRNLKDNIQPTKLGLDFVNDLNPVSYRWKDETIDTSTHHGIVAQDVIETLKNYGIDSLNDFAGITYNKESDEYSARYTEFIPILIKAVQELSAEVKELKEKN